MLTFERHDAFHATIARCAAALAFAGALVAVVPAAYFLRPFAFEVAVALGALGGLWAGAAAGPLPRRLLLGLSVAASAGVAYVCIERFDALGVLATWPLPLRGAALGTLGAAVVGIGLLPRHVRLGLPGPAARRLPAAPVATGETALLAERAGNACVTILDALAADRSPESVAARAQTTAFARGVDRLVSRLAGLERALGGTVEGTLEARADEASARAEAAAEAGTRTEYQRAAAGFRDQLARVRELRAGRERGLASLTADVATLERVALAVVARRAAISDRDAGALRAELEELGALGERMDHEREAIAELEA
jgi:hypothetical protein